MVGKKVPVREIIMIVTIAIIIAILTIIWEMKLINTILLALANDNINQIGPPYATIVFFKLQSNFHKNDLYIRKSAFQVNNLIIYV